MTTQARSARAAISAAGLAACATLLACGESSPQTGIVAEITSNLSVPGELDGVTVTVTDEAGATVYYELFPVGTAPPENTLPLRIGFQPGGSANAPFRIEASGGKDLISRVSRSATLTFVSGRVVLLPLPLLAACVDVTCSQPTETCGETGVCGTNAVDPTRLPTYHPGTGGGGSGPGGTSGRGGSVGSGGFGGIGGRGGSSGTGGSVGSGGFGGIGGRGGAGGTSGTGGSAGSGGFGGGGGRGGAGGTSGTAGRGGSAGSGGTGGGGRGGSGGSGGSGGGGVVTTLNNGLVAYWAFDQAGTSFPDYSGNANTLGAPAQNAWTASGHVGGALDLTGSTFFGAAAQGTASVNTITSTVSIAGWIVPQAGTVRTIVSRVINTGFWKLGLGDNGALRFTAGSQVAQGPNAVGDGSQWVHVAATYDGAGVRLYVGGALVAQAMFGAVSLQGGPPDGGSGGYGIDVGGAYDSINATLAENYRGVVDELTVYNRALTVTEVDALAHGALPMRR